jgi:hypothetical protein
MVVEREQTVRSIVPMRSLPRVRFVDYETQKIALTEQKYAQELRKLTNEVHVESIRADVAEVGVEIASNEYYKAEVERDISEIYVDEALVRRDIANVRLEYVEEEFKYLENRSQLMLDKWDEELRTISIEVDIRDFDNTNKETIAAELGVPLTQGRFSASGVKGLLTGLLGGKR